MTFTSNFIEANGIQQHYYRSGGNKPPLVLLHGFTDDAACWLPITAALVETYDVIMPDVRGHGKSARIAGIGFSSESLAEDAAGLIQALDLKRPAVMGHSLGGFTALLLAATHPELVGCLLLEDPVLLPTLTPEKEADDRAGLRTWAENLRRMQGESREALIAGERVRSPKWSDAELQPWADSKYQVDLAVFEEMRARPAWQPLMAKVQCPVLLIYGDLGTIVNPESAAEAAALWETGEAVQIPNAGHCIRRDNLEDFMRAVLDFLQQHYAS